MVETGIIFMVIMTIMDLGIKLNDKIENKKKEA